MVNHEYKHPLGVKAKDKITGFTGILNGACHYTTGCNQYLMVAPSVENKEPVAIWYDEARIEVLEHSTQEVNSIEEPGADIPAPGGSIGH